MRILPLLLLLGLLVAPALAETPARPLRTNAARAVVLKATRNTRDLGGLPVRGGFLGSHRVYRSGALCFLTAEDVEIVKGLELSTLVDLRLDREIQKEGPDRPALTRTVRRNVRFPMGNSRGLGAEAYGVLLEENGKAIRGFFELLADPGALPLLFHCSAGKDRTGILTALLLESLGTPRPVILDDYMQSVRNSAGLEVHPEWLQVVFDAVDRAGGIGPFLEARGVSSAVRERVARNLVEPPEERP